MTVTADPSLDARLDVALPRELPGGTSQSVFVVGACFHRDEAIDRLELLADGVATEALAHSMPRIDVYLKLHPPSVWDSESPEVIAGESRSYRSGFWGTIEVEMPSVGAVELSVRATLADGTVAENLLATIAVAPSERATAGGGEASIAICMATYEPDPELLRSQVDSIRAQTRRDWICLISDDCSSPAGVASIERAIEGDDRFVLSRSAKRLGFYRNFERALNMVPADVGLVALSDQDDRWYPEKLEVLSGGLGDAQLVYSDQRLVDVGGAVLANSYWAGERSNNYRNLASLLIANTVTGAASLFRRELLDLALPFPATPGLQYHDHWLALAARVSGGIAYVDRPLYDYVQHGAATLGYEGANQGLNDPAKRARGIRNRIRKAAAGSRISYFFAYCRLRVLAETLLARHGKRMAGRDAATLRRFIASDRSPASLAWLAARRLRARLGRTETRDAERIILIGVAWTRAIAALGRLRNRPIPGVTYDASLPPSPVVAADRGHPPLEHPLTRQLDERLQPLELSVTDAAPERVNVLVPTIELQHLFGGYIAKFNLARKLAGRGHRVRILTVDPTSPLPGSWREQVEAYAGLAGLFDDVEVEFARDLDAPVQVNPRDAFVATTWWTAHAAASALRSLERSRFLYLIQEFEPFTHPLGSWSAAAMSTYGMPHVALFSTELLQQYFADRGHGVYAAGRDAGDRDSAAFENAITEVSPPAAEDLSGRSRRRLLFYARPEPHGSRNMFELGLLALRQAVDEGVFDDGWDLFGIGSVEPRDRRVALTADRELELLSKRGQGDYASMLASHDVGLSLMYTPHPSLVPIEMASAGLVTVTNSYETKTPAAMESISANLIAVTADVGGIVAGLKEAVARSSDHEARRAGAEVSWSRDWDQSFDDALMARIDDLLAAT